MVVCSCAGDRYSWWGRKIEYPGCVGWLFVGQQLGGGGRVGLLFLSTGGFGLLSDSVCWIRLLLWSCFGDLDPVGLGVVSYGLVLSERVGQGWGYVCVGLSSGLSMHQGRISICGG